ncbi:MAG: TIGR04282 family arsenosugar biosynthesis glycosyltransferase [Candidatus Loosdrechtia sp.]|uniref:TIGR04282 family arsenosugar biosynthesis glycosyltransferase n=1 Tax=Candidatus Loosdrechtia sp. TaxID=3101272 RepID=UPI003A6C2076|nr:MAG: glycosyltransferase [Candidatus Jettenia sp. AMX2]
MTYKLGNYGKVNSRTTWECLAPRALIIFLKYPEPGKVKTRLAKVIGHEKACEAYIQLAEGIIKNILLKKTKLYDIYIFFTPADKGCEINDWLKRMVNIDFRSDVYAIPQEGEALGEKMLNAFQYVFWDKVLCCKIKNIQHDNKEGIRETVPVPSFFTIAGGKKFLSCNSMIIGTDCPDVDVALIESAFEALQENDVVVGPCEDGGYYLLGMSKLVPGLFANISWSTHEVFRQTMKKIQENNLSCHVLKTLADIDTAEDYYRYANIRCTSQ